MAISIKPANRGKLHTKLGVPAGKKIPVAKIKRAETSSSPSLRKEAQFADNARGFAKPGAAKPEAGKVKLAAMAPSLGSKPPRQKTTPVATDRGAFGIKG